MPETDPSGNTEAFRAFTEKATEEPATAGRLPVIIGAAVVAVVLIAVLIWALA